MKKIIKNWVLSVLWVTGLLIAGCENSCSPIVNLFGAGLIVLSSYLVLDQNSETNVRHHRHFSHYKRMKPQFTITGH